MPAPRVLTPAALLALQPRIDEVYHAFDHVESAADPVHLVRRFRDPADQEVVGFCASGLAFGRVASVLQSVEALLAVMGPSPADYVHRFDPVREAPRLAHIVHRWIRGVDLTALLLVLQRMVREAGSLEAFFMAGDDLSAPDVGPGIESFSRRAMETDLRPAYGRVPARAGVGFFFPQPSGGSACKRMNLFLRWMVRRDAIDLGVWTRVAPARLVVPLDTHIIRVGRCLRLTRLTSPGWKMAADITSVLRRLDPADPVRYDFSLCHVGMMGACGNAGTGRSDQCPLNGSCRPSRAPRSVSAGR